MKTTNKLQKPKSNTPIVSGSFYWVIPFEGASFEPAKCLDFNGTATLYFRFTDGSIITTQNAWKVEPLTPPHKTLIQTIKLKNIKTIKDKICMVKLDGTMLRYCHLQTKEMCIEAVKQNGMSLEFVKEQTLEICCLAFDNNNESIKFIKNEDHLTCLKELIKQRKALDL